MRDVRSVSYRSSKLRSKLITSGVVVGACFTVLMGVYGVLAIVQSQAQSVPTETVQSAQVNDQEAVPKVISKKTLKDNTTTILELEILLSNPSNQVQQFSPLLQLQVVDDRGILYPFTLTKTTSLDGGPIAPTTSISGTVDFAISPTANPVKLLFRHTPEGPDIEINL